MLITFQNDTYCFFAKPSALDGKIMKQFASWLNLDTVYWKTNPKANVNDPISLQKYGSMDPLFCCKLCHHLALEAIIISTVYYRLRDKSATSPKGQLPDLP